MTNYQLIVIISIDSRTIGGGHIQKIPMHSKPKDVGICLEEMKQVLNDPEFKIDNDFTLIKSKKDEVQFSTPFTIVDLEFDMSDVVEVLKQLEVKDYSETLIDKDDENPPYLFVFGKYINSKLVYIKFKVKGDAKKRVLCVSFHYPKHDMKFPYA